MKKDRDDLKVEVEDLSAIKKKLAITVPSETVAKEIKDMYKRLSANVSVSGFRRGAVPRNVLMARYGETIRHDVVAKLVETTYPRALQEKSFIPVANPDVDAEPSGIEEGKDFSYSVTFEINPEVDVDGYKGMEIKTGPVAPVTESDVEGGLKRLQESNLELIEVDRAAIDGDAVMVDFEATRDGEPIKGYKNKDFRVMLGEPTPLPGFAEALKGLSKSDKKEVMLRFPDDYNDPELAGKEACFSITVKSVEEKSVSAIDDEFAKDLDCENLDELKKKVREELDKAREKEYKEGIKAQILTNLIDKHSFEVPAVMVSKYHSLLLNNVVDGMKAGVVKPEDQELSAEDFKKKYLIEAERRVREDIILDAIAVKEKIEVTKEEADEAVKFLAQSRNVSFESLMSRIEQESSIEIIKDGLKHEKVFDIIIAALKTAA
jgi:trigger factor